MTFRYPFVPANSMWFFLLLCLLGGDYLVPALAQEARPDPCSDVAAKQKGPCYRQKFAEADRELNAVYKRLYATFETARQKAMQDNSSRHSAPLACN